MLQTYRYTVTVYHSDDALCVLHYLHRCNVESISLDVFHRSLSSTTALSKKYRPHGEPKKWPLYNDVVYPPSLPNEPLRPAVSGVC